MTILTFFILAEGATQTLPKQWARAEVAGSAPVTGVRSRAQWEAR